MSSSSSLIICKLAPGGGGVVKSIEFLRFLELFLRTLGSWCCGGMALACQSVSLAVSSYCLYPGCGSYTLSEILLITLKGPVQGQCNFLDFLLGTTGLCK